MDSSAAKAAGKLGVVCSIVAASMLRGRAALQTGVKRAFVEGFSPRVAAALSDMLPLS